MDLVDSIEEMFQWQIPFYGIDNPEVASFDDMLVDMEFQEMPNLVPEQEAAAAAQPESASPSHRLIRTTPVARAMQAPGSSNRNDNNPALTVINTVERRTSELQIGTRGFELPPAPTSPPLSSAPNTPPVAKPRRSARSKSSTAPKTTKTAQAVQELLTLDAAAKEDQAPTIAEHIIRERQRRDDMASKYSILESLLPPVPKRERAMVVDDAISFVGDLQQKKDQLLKRRADLKQRAESPGSSKRTKSLDSGFGTVVNHPPGLTVTPSIIKQQNLSTVNVHLGEEEIVMEIVWSQPRSNFQSTLLQAVELWGFLVTKCSILRVGSGYIQCVITCTKSQVLTQRTSEIQFSSTMIIRAIRNVLTL